MALTRSKNGIRFHLHLRNLMITVLNNRSRQKEDRSRLLKRWKTFSGKETKRGNWNCTMRDDSGENQSAREEATLSKTHSLKAGAVVLLHMLDGTSK